jgi:hypothetical protein
MARAIGSSALALAFLAVLFLPGRAASEPLTQATLTVLLDTVTAIPELTGSPHPGTSGELLQARDRVMTGSPGGATLTFLDGSQVELDAAAELEIVALEQTPAGGALTIVSQAVGVAVHQVSQLGASSSYQVDTPNTSTLVRGTTFRTRVARDPLSGVVTEEDVASEQGVVEVRSAGATYTLQPGEVLRVVPASGGGLETVFSAPVSTVQPGRIQTSQESGLAGGGVTVAAPNQAPQVGEIAARLRPPFTFYSVQASDPDGDTLSYQWTLQPGQADCNSFTSSGNQATWEHGEDTPCSHGGPLHPGTITVVVSDGQGHSVTRTYANGSADNS